MRVLCAVAMTPEAQMIAQMVLLRAVDGSWEGWRCMALEEFLRRMDLGAWKVEQLLVGMVLPVSRQQLQN